MEVTALRITLMMNVWMLPAQVHHSYCDQKHGEVFPRVLPDRLQFFEYESISFTCECEGSAEWRVMRRIAATNSSKWAPSAGTHTIGPAFSSDSGAYWCEDGAGLRSSAVNISVTAGHVILESPALPVKEGGHVTLHCRKKKSAARLIADFYKDGLRIWTGYDGKMTISNASTSDEGLYKCHIEDGESAESLLAVREPLEETPPPRRNGPALRWMVVTAVLGALLLLVVVGVRHCRRHREPRASSKPRLPEESAVYSSVYYSVCETEADGASVSTNTSVPGGIGVQHRGRPSIRGSAV